MTMPDTLPPDVFDRDSLTIEFLERAEKALLEALKVMPNHVDSVFDPMDAVPVIQDALTRIRGSRRDALGRSPDAEAHRGGERPMTDQDQTPQRFLIEHLRTIDEAGAARGLVAAWIAVGDIEIAESYGFRVALEAWAGEQAEEPPLGAYRVVKHEAYGSSLVEFELVETREREIRQIERVAPVSEIESAVQS